MKRFRFQAFPTDLALLLLVVFGTSACHTPLIRTHAGTFKSTESDRELTERRGFWKQVVLYIPNRLVDAFDMASVGVGAVLGIGLDVRVTRWGQFALEVGTGAGFGYDDRSHNATWASASSTAAFGPWRAGAGVGTAPSIGDWEVGAALGPLKGAVDLAEVLDFALGWFYIDILRDDYGWE